MSLFWGSTEFYASLVDANREEQTEIDLLVLAYLRDVNYVSKRSTIMNVVYATINVGLVALPLVAEHAGLPLFMAGVGLVATSAAYSSCMIVNMVSEQGVKTLEDLCEKAFGVKGFVAVCLFQIIFSLSLMCITLDVWADILQSILSSYNAVPEKLKHRFFGLLVGLCLTLPVSVYAKSMSSLRFSPYCSVIAILTAILCIVADVSCSNGSEAIRSSNMAQQLLYPKQLWWTLSLVVTFCFSNNQKVLNAFYCLRRRTKARWQFVVRRSHVIIALMYMCFGCFGYLSNIKDERDSANIDYFLDYDGSITAVIYFNVLRGIVALSLLLTIPVDCLVAATTCKRLYAKWVRYGGGCCVNRQSKMSDQFASPSDPMLHLPSDDNDSLVCKPSLGTQFSASDEGDFTVSHSSCRQASSGLFVNSIIGSKSITSDRGDMEEGTGPRESLKSTASGSSQRSGSAKSSGKISPVTRDQSDGTGRSSTSVAGISAAELQGPNSGETPVDNNDKQTSMVSALLSAAGASGAICQEDNEGYEVRTQDNLGSPEKQPVRNRHAQVSNSSCSDARADDCLDGEGSALFRQTSLDAAMERSSESRLSDVLVVLGLWVLALGLCVSYKDFGMLGILLGPIATAFLVYIVPSMIYFRLGLGTDFQAIPICGFVPNQLYMQILQVLGLLLLFGNIAAVFYSCFVDQVLISL